jgi:hypothetical protein
MIALMKRSWSTGDKALPSFLYFPDLFCVPIFTLVSLQISQNSLVCLLRQFLTYRGALREENGSSWVAMDTV